MYSKTEVTGAILIGDVNGNRNIRVDAARTVSRHRGKKLPLIDGGADRAV
jgi:hypothetical protein